MEAAQHFLLRDLGVSLGYAVRRMLRRRNTAIAIAVIALPIALLLLSVVLLSGAIQAFEELFSAIITSKKEPYGND